MENLGFGGEVADLYHQYRHGYPAAVIDILARVFGLTGEDVVIDLGCGTGQLTLPLAARVRAVIGVDPEPDMLRRARGAAREAGAANVSWMLGADTDLPALRGALGENTAGALTVGQALHWMNADEVFRSAALLARPGGGVAVVTNGTPLWLQDSGWSAGLRAFLARWLGHELGGQAGAWCGTDEESQRRYAAALTAAGFDVASDAVDYVAELTFDQLAGGVCSAIPASLLPTPAQRPGFTEQLRAAVGSQDRFSEPVHVAVLTGRVPG